MKRLFPMLFAIALFFAGCQRAALPQPDFPLREDVVLAALEQTGLPGVISESETQSYTENHISYTLRDPVQTYGDTENKVVTAGVSSALVEGGRFLSMTFISDAHVLKTVPFAWEDWKRQIEFATLLYGGFADADAVYRAFAEQEAPQGAESFAWDARLAGGYCRASYSLMNAGTAQEDEFGITRRLQRYFLRVTIYASEAQYQSMQKAAEEKRKELEDNRAKAPQ